MLIAPLILVFALAVGNFAVRPLRLRPASEFVSSLAAGLFLLFLAIFGLFATRADPRAYWLVTLAAGVACFIGRGRLLALCRQPTVRPLLLPWVAVLAATILFALPLRHVSGGAWVLDWIEHWQRSAYFLGQFPDDYKFIQIYALPARPPMQNVLTAFAGAHDSLADPRQGRLDFRTYQLVSMVLASTTFLSAALLARRFGGRGRLSRQSLYWLVAAATVLSVSYLANALFLWTKLLTVFYVLLAVHLYLGSYRMRPGGLRTLRLCAVAVAAGVGCLVHYSAAPYAILIFLHLAWVRLRDRERAVADLAMPFVAGVLTLAPWLVWSAANYGWSGTLGSNTTVSDSAAAAEAGGNLRRIALNGLNTFVPHPFVFPWREFTEGGLLPNGKPYRGYAQPSELGMLRDYVFGILPTTLPWALGSGGGVVLLYLLVKNVRLVVSRDRGFWALLVPGGVVLGLIVSGAATRDGIAQVTMLPLVFLGLTWVIAKLPRLPAAVRIVMLVGWVVDVTLLLLPHLIVQSRVFQLVSERVDSDVISTPLTLSYRAVRQFRYKLYWKFTFLGDTLVAVQLPLLILCGLTFLAAWLLAARLLFPRREGPQ